MAKRAYRLGIIMGLLCVIGTGHARGDSKDLNSASQRQGVLAWVGGRKVTVADFEDRYYRMTPEFQRMYAGKKRRSHFLFHVIREVLMPVLASRLGYERDPLIQKELDSIEERYLPDDAAPRRDAVLARIMSQRLFEKELIVPDSAIRRFYNFRKEVYEKSLLIEAVRMDLPTLAEVAQAQQALSKGKSFESLAKSMSHDPAMADWAGPKSPLLVDPVKPAKLEKVLLAMQVGQVSGAIEDNGAFVILKLKAVRPATLEALRPTIYSMLQEDRMNAWVSRHWKDVPIRIDETLLAALELRPPR